jgi:hypothetical protein
MIDEKMQELPEMLTPSAAMELLSCGRKALVKLRLARPDIAVKLPGFKHWRYIKSKMLDAAGLHRKPNH